MTTLMQKKVYIYNQLLIVTSIFLQNTVDQCQSSVSVSMKSADYWHILFTL